MKSVSTRKPARPGAETDLTHPYGVEADFVRCDPVGARLVAGSAAGTGAQGVTRHGSELSCAVLYGEKSQTSQCPRRLSRRNSLSKAGESLVKTIDHDRRMTLRPQLLRMNWA